MPTKTLVSHASEDKIRFVRDFVDKLRARGVDAWYDEYEILPGDSIVDKVFEEAVKHSGVIIIVLSKISVEKPWVRGELNASILKRFAGKAKIIPVLIEDCEVPEALKDTLYVRINDLASYDHELTRIVASILGETLKPALGPVPAYTSTPMIAVPGLTAVDNSVLRVVYAEALKTGSELQTPQSISEAVGSVGVPESQMLESLEFLAGRGFLEMGSALGSQISHFRITPFGMDKYAEANIENYRALIRAVALKILNEDKNSSDKISQELGQPLLLINHIMIGFSKRGFCKLSGAISTQVVIYDVTAEFRRAF